MRYKRPHGAHTQGTGFSKDREKINTAQEMGWVVLELETNSIRSGRALRLLERYRATRQIEKEEGLLKD